MTKRSEFKRIDFNDNNLRRFLLNGDLTLCDYSLGVRYLWDDYYKTHVYASEDYLVCRQGTGKNATYSFPLGNDLDGAFDAIERDRKKWNYPLKFVAVPADRIRVLEKRYGKENVSYHFGRNWSDYVYNISDLADFAGKQYHGQRNHVNKFISLYPNAVYRKITAADVDALLAFLDEYARRYPKSERLWELEIEGSQKLIKKYSELPLVGSCVTIDGAMIAFCIGEIYGNVMTVHVEKAFREYEGIYPYIVQKFAAEFRGLVKYENRQDDSGDPGLRISKMQYHPAFLADKYRVVVSHPMDRMTELPRLQVGDLVLDEFTDEDADSYFELATDDDLNVYWGYDYRTDFPSPVPADFIEDIKGGFSAHITANWAIRLDGKLIGEVVLYDRDHRSGAELGCRIFREFWGHGYGRAAYKAVADKLGEIGFVYLRARCCHPNIASYKMISAAGFSPVAQDDTFIHFVRKYQ